MNIRPVFSMSEARESFVCDLTLVMRIRLLCGLYNGRAVPPRYRLLAKAYCITLAMIFLIYSYYVILSIDLIILIIVWLIHLTEYLLAIVVSLWTADEYIYTFFTENEVTDVTLDSRIVFKYLKKSILNSYIFMCFVNMAQIILLLIASWERPDFKLMLFFLEIFILTTYTTKMSIMALFSNRLLVLKRRLQRYGFRTIGRRSPQPYCDIYHEILRGLEATNNPLKPMLFFDWVVCGMKTIMQLLIFISVLNVEGIVNEAGGVAGFTKVILFTKSLITTFGHILLLESADEHCEHMAEFTATELIKTPTAEERQRMREFLDALESRGARYSVLRALPLDARCVLRALGFYTAQAVVFANTAKLK